MHARNEVSECDAQQQGDKPRADRVGPIPSAAPLLGGHLRAPLERHDADNQADKNEEQSKIHAGEHGCVPLGERREGRPAGGQQPHLVAVPVGADRTHHLRAFTIALGCERKEHADTEVEAFEDEVDRPQNGDEDEPQN